MGYHDSIFTYGRQGQSQKEAVELLARIVHGTPADKEAATREAKAWLAWRHCYSASAPHIGEAQGR